MYTSIINEISPLTEKDCFYIVERYKTEFTYPLHQHREFELNFIEGGAGVTRVVGDSVETIGDYELVLLGSENLEHVWEQGECRSRTIREITIQFSPDIFTGSFLSKNQFDSIQKMLDAARRGLSFPLHAIMKVYSLIDTISSEKRGFYQVIKILTILYELSVCDGARTLSNSSFVRVRQNADSRRVARVEEYINDHYAEEIRLRQVASIAGMAPTAFSRFFKVRTGRTLSDYIIDMRLGKAARMLVDSTMSVAEISYECGFNNLSNFNRIFKKKKGVTPKTFREHYRKKKIIC